MQDNEEWQIAFKIIEKLEKNGYEAVIVGGAVRDFLLERNVHDVDVATNALPHEVKAVFTHTVDVGIKHGTILVILEDGSVEVTTYRTDGDYTDHRRPKDVQFVRSLAEDLKRRDFTMNAIAMRKDQSLVDYYGGEQDIRDGIIRAVGNPVRRFSEDSLRMLRAIRFSAQLGFSIDVDTMEAIQLKASEIDWVAKERVKAEIDKVWLSEHVLEGISNLLHSGLHHFLPGDFSSTSWQSFSTSKAVVGWAYFALLNGDNWHGILRNYRLSNKEMAEIKAILDAYKALLNGWTKMDYFRFDEQTLFVAIQFANYQDRKTIITVHDVQHEKTQLPINDRSELVVNGLDIQTWSGEKRGPWLKTALDALLYAVVTGQVRNERQQIKHWFMNEYFNER